MHKYTFHYYSGNKECLYICNANDLTEAIQNFQQIVGKLFNSSFYLKIN